MRRSGWLCFWMLLLPLLLPDSAPAAAQSAGAAPPLWNTLSGNEPAVIAKGGFSGIFPESSSIAYDWLTVLQLPSVTSWCDVQLTKDSVGICLPDVNMSNCTAIGFPGTLYSNMSKSYLVNGRNERGWFTLDYTYNDLQKNVPLTRASASRPDNFDGGYSIQTVEKVGNSSQSLWLNIQHDSFYKQHNLSMTKSILEVTRTVSVTYISSAEVVFLQNIAAALKSTKIKTILRIPEDDAVEPSTNRSYDTILSNLTFVKTFASGILIPKNKIWPLTSAPDLFLLPSTSTVINAHKANLEVFASGFANDAIIAYNYSYNPVSEYLKFIDNGNFSVDGFLSDFPSTAWEAIGCFSHLGNGASKNISEKPLIISHNGDSGDFPPCTDLAYEKAIDGSSDFIDCPVQVTKDGTLICLASIDLFASTTVSKSPFATRFSTIPEIKSEAGIYTFNFTWEEIQKNLKPQIFSPYFPDYRLQRNTANKNAGGFVTLAQFLDIAKEGNLTGVLIIIENAHFVVEKLGIDIVNEVIMKLDEARYNETSQQVMIQSTNSSTLKPFKQQTKYKMVYKLDDDVGDVESNALKDIKAFADAVAVSKRTIYPLSNAYITRLNKLVATLHSAKLEVYAFILMNEFVNIPWDYFGDAIMEIHNLVSVASIDGVITDFPSTSHLYRSRKCSKNFDIPLIPPGFLIDPNSMVFEPPTLPPLPPLKESDVLESPLPSVVKPLSPPPLSSPGDSSNAWPCRLPSLFVHLTTLFLLHWYIK